MTSNVRILVALAALVALPLSASAQSSLSARPSVAANVRPAQSPSLAMMLAEPAPTQLALPAEWSGSRSDRTDSLMAQWDAAFRVTARRGCFRGETNPAVPLVNMLGLLEQSDAVPASERAAVAAAMHRAWYDVVNHGGCTGLSAPPFQAITAIDGAEWLSRVPMAGKGVLVERDDAGRIVAMNSPANVYGRDVTRRHLFGGAAGSEQLMAAEDVLLSSTKSCALDMAEIATSLSARYSELHVRRTFSLTSTDDRETMCESFAGSSGAASRWSIEYVNPRTDLVEVSVQLRRTAQGGLEVVAAYPGATYQ